MADKVDTTLTTTGDLISSSVEPSSFEPSSLEPSAIEPASFEPASFEPSSFEPSSFEPSAIEPASFEPSSLEPSSFEPPSFEPSSFEPLPLTEISKESAEQDAVHSSPGKTLPNAHFLPRMTTKAIDVSPAEEDSPKVSIPVEDKQGPVINDQPLEKKSSLGKKKLVFVGADPSDETEEPGASTKSGEAVPNGAEGGHHRKLQQTASHHRSFAVIGKTMVGLGRNGKSRAERKVVADLRTVSSTLVYKVLRPFFWAMRVSGIFFIRPRGGQEAASTGCCARRFPGFVRRMPTKSEAYSCFVCAILGLNLLRSFTAFDTKSEFNHTFSFKLTWMALWFEGFSRTLISVIFWHRRKGGFQEFLIGLDGLFFTDGIIPYEHALSKMMTIYLIVTGVLLCITIALFGYGISSKNPDLLGVYDVALTPYKVDPDSPVPLDVFVRVSILILFTWNVIVCFLFIGFFVIICYLMYKEFEYLCRTFKLKITEDGRFTDDLERFRVTHQSRCKMVENFDGLFKHFIANTYLVEIPLFCLLLYTLLLPGQTPVARATEAFWMIFVAGQTILVSIASIAVNTQAHSILSFIYSITASNASTERQLEINMFLNKLTGTSVGLTAWDMFDINKPAMLTIVGLLLSFFFLLMQFNNPLQIIPTAQCDCPIDPSIVNDTFNTTNTSYDLSINMMF